MKRISITLAFGVALVTVAAYTQEKPKLVPIAAQSSAIWNGVTVSNEGRLFVNFPTLTPRPHPSVAEIGKDGSVSPFPAAVWNSWSPGKPVERAFVGTNAIRIGPEGSLWVVDTGSPAFGSDSLAHAAKVVRIDLTRNAVQRVYPLNSTVAMPKSYIDDIRFHGNLAYLTDAGVPGIIVLNLTTGSARRVLDHDPTTIGTKPIVVDGETVRGTNGKPLILNTDQMEVSPDGKWLYYQSLEGPLFRIETRYMDDPAATPDDVSRHAERWYDTGPLGGTAIDSAGNLYLEELGNDSIVQLAPNRKVTVLIRDHRLHWADAPWIHDGWLYIPEAQIDRAAQFHNGSSQVVWPLHIYKIPLVSR